MLAMEHQDSDDLPVDAAQVLRTVEVQIEHEPLLQVRHRGFEAIRPQGRNLTQTDKGPQTVSQTQLTNGHYIVDCPVAPQLLSKVSTSGMHPHQIYRDEFSHTRYTAVNCDPNEFLASHYTLRPRLFARPRTIELFIAVTVYNEEDILLGRTLETVLQNIKYLCALNKGQWDKDGWKKIVFCIIGDGRAKFHRRAYSLLAALGLYQEGIAVECVDGRYTQAHIYEVHLSFL
jgi:chitin synthase